MSEPKACPRSLLVILLALGLAGLAACSEKDASSTRSADAKGAAVVPASVPGEAPAAQLPMATRAMRVTAELQLAVDDVDGSLQAIRSAVAKAGGYVSDARVAGRQDRKQADLEAKVPVGKLAEFRDTLAGTGTITSESEKAEDVTEQRADLKARLKNAKAQEKRILDLLSDRTGNLADVIAAEKSLGEVRELVERLEAADGTLDGQVAFATVKIHVGQRQTPEPVSIAGKIGGAFSRGFTLAGDALIGAAVVIGTAGPTLLMFGAIGYALFRLVRAVASRIKPKALPYVAPPQA